MICGYDPKLSPANCCIDFLNTICPECDGTGRATAVDRPGAKTGRSARGEGGA
jgi:hypothetical protein